MIQIEMDGLVAMKCNTCTHRHVCMYRKKAEEQTILDDTPFIVTVTECRYYKEQTLEPIKIN